MALTSTISNTIKDPNGVVQSGVAVTVTLMPTAGFRSDDATEVARTVSTTTNGSGVWSLALERNSNITPANTTYEVVEYIPQSAGGPRVWTITVGASNQTVLAALTSSPPAATSSSFLTQASADARYQALGSISSATPTQDSQTAGTAGVSTAASRDDHQHWQPSATPRGRVGFASSTSTQSGISTVVDVTGCSATFTAVAGRVYQVTARVESATSSVSDVNVFVLIQEGAAEIGRVATMHSLTGREATLFGSTVLTGVSAGSHTYKLTIQATGGTISSAPNASSPNFILIEDIGT